MSSIRNNRLAIVFFSLYLLLYAGFILLNIAAPEVMEWQPWAGVNLAIWYGFGLIFVAIILAFLYGSLCRQVLLEPVSRDTPEESDA